MITIAIYTTLGAIGALIIFGIFFYLSEAQQTSAPFGLIFVGLACGITAYYIAPWTTAIILGLYAIGCWVEWWQDTHPPS